MSERVCEICENKPRRKYRRDAQARIDHTLSACRRIVRLDFEETERRITDLLMNHSATTTALSTT
jgi:hypothetical protein